ncbi:MAG: Hsp20/alpha crystallin family protein [Deltaproteobacteria bacterium]|nr:Hsp20/alpha crystallin family protein [Deltaproteobacteria bacterium]MBI3386336.1 Hsp20/alpha crystallin family protein [Deltaproteobacteria bacterium]
MALFRLASDFDPTNALLTLQRELERAFGNSRGLDLGVSGRGVFPPVNVFSDREGYIIRLEVPGVSPEQISIETQGRTLTVKGKREFTPPSDGSFHRHERGAGEFSRSLQLPLDLDLSRAEASCKHGLLTVRIPKREDVKPRQITVQAA